MATEQFPDRAGVITFPPLLFISTFAVAMLLRFLFPTPVLSSLAAFGVGLVVMLIGLPILLLSFRQMTRNKTTINPSGATTRIVGDGMYAYTRNPMYLALMLLYTGGCIMANAWWGLLLLIPLLMMVQKGVVEREEEYLTRKFGDEYLRYKDRVRRWL